MGAVDSVAAVAEDAVDSVIAGDAVGDAGTSLTAAYVEPNDPLLIFIHYSLFMTRVQWPRRWTRWWR